MTAQELERIKGRCEGACISDQEGHSYWRASYIKDVSQLIEAVSPQEKLTLVVEPKVVSVPSMEGLLISINKMISDSTEIRDHSISRLVADQLHEAQAHLARAQDCFMRAQGKEA